MRVDQDIVQRKYGIFSHEFGLRNYEIVKVKLSLCLIKDRAVKHVRECSSLPVCFTSRYTL